MAMTDEERRAHAKRLILLHNDEYEFLTVVEDEELEDADEADQVAIYGLMYAARIEVSFDSKD